MKAKHKHKHEHEHEHRCKQKAKATKPTTVGQKAQKKANKKRSKKVANSRYKFTPTVKIFKLQHSYFYMLKQFKRAQTNTHIYICLLVGLGRLSGRLLWHTLTMTCCCRKLLHNNVVMFYIEAGTLAPTPTYEHVPVYVCAFIDFTGGHRRRWTLLARWLVCRLADLLANWNWSWSYNYADSRFVFRRIVSFLLESNFRWILFWFRFFIANICCSCYICYICCCCFYCILHMYIFGIPLTAAAICFILQLP